MKILVIRFRQMGDAVLATALLNSIKKSFPDAQIHFVLNSRLEPLFNSHPSVHRVIPFTDRERHSPFLYVAKIFRLMLTERYDAIIDMRSTFNCIPFWLFGIFAKRRIGLRKGYTRFFLNRRIDRCDLDTDVVSHNLRFLQHLSCFGNVSPCRDFTLNITPAELQNYRCYLSEMGVDASRPLLLCGVVSKLSYKCWPIERMKAVVERVLCEYPDWQIVFNYAPGAEEVAARALYDSLGRPEAVKINVKASSMRQLVALATCSDAYFGNEGGTRHIAQAVGTPSFVVVSPHVRKSNWIIPNSVESLAIEPADMVQFDEPVAMARYNSLSYDQKYALITPEAVLDILLPFLCRHSPRP